MGDLWIVGVAALVVVIPRLLGRRNDQVDSFYEREHRVPPAIDLLPGGSGGP